MPGATISSCWATKSWPMVARQGNQKFCYMSLHLCCRTTKIPCRATSVWYWLPDRATGFQNECETLHINLPTIFNYKWVKQLYAFNFIFENITQSKFLDNWKSQLTRDILSLSIIYFELMRFCCSSIYQYPFIFSFAFTEHGIELSMENK